MQIDIVYLVIAFVLTAITVIGLYLRQRPRLTIPYLALASVAMLFAVYYILNVVFGSGRTGWP